MAKTRRVEAGHIARVERRLKALELRKAGASYRRIGDTLGVAMVTVRRDIAHELAQLAAETQRDAAELRGLELSRLDAVMLGSWTAATRGDADAARIVLRCIEQRVKLLGLALTADAAGSINLTHIELRWPHGGQQPVVIDGDPPTAAPGAAGGGTEPGALPGGGSGPALGQVTVRLAGLPGDGGE